MKRNEELERLKDFDADELVEEVDRLKESLFRLRFKLSLGEREAIKNIRREKKSLARVNTLLRQKQLAAQ
jgi:large subunit ribosomal protein L29